jgi:hypothetical protein
LAAGSFAPGSDGLGDPMFPLAGNGGYDVSNYTTTVRSSSTSLRARPVGIR